jgi:hypothetical protein
VPVSFDPEVGVADTIFVTGNNGVDVEDATVTINSIPNIARHVRLWFDIEQKISREYLGIIYTIHT